MKKSTVFLLLFTNGLAYYSVFFISYIHYNYYNVLMDAMSLTNTQMGLIATITGIVGIFGYFIAGVLADIISTKKLMIAAYGCQVIFLIIYSFLPQYSILMIVQGAAAVCCLCLFFGAMDRYVRALGSPEMEGRLYGLHFMFIGIGAVIFALLSSFIVSRFGSAATLVWMTRINAAWLIIAILINGFCFKPAVVASNGEDDRFKVSFIVTVLRNKTFWLATIMWMGLYFTIALTVYFIPMLNAVYGVPLAIVTILGPIRSFATRIVCAPVAGILIDKYRSIKVLTAIAFVCFIGGVGVLLVPSDMGTFSLVAALVLFAILVFSFNMSAPAMFPCITDLGLPTKMRGTALGLLCTFTYLSDAFFYTLCGNWLDQYGDTGYSIIFAVCTVLIGIGFVFGFILVRKRKKEGITQPIQA